MEIRTLKYFITIVDAGSISKAAQELGITQPTLSRQMQELEESLGKVLMIRGKRRITLTHDGVILNHRPSLAVTTNPIYLIYHGLMAVFLLNNLSSVRRFHVA